MYGVDALSCERIYAETPPSEANSLAQEGRRRVAAPEAITLLQSGEPIALVSSDIVMPGGMTGYDVAEWVGSMKPHLKVLLSSGYSDMPLAVSEAARKVKVLGKPSFTCAISSGCTVARRFIFDDKNMDWSVCADANSKHLVPTRQWLTPRT